MNGAGSDEEKIARKVIALIQACFAKEKSGSGKSQIPRISVKFCGGCNPSMDRGAVAQIISRDLADVYWAPPDEEVDILLIINGCLSSCAERPEVEEKAAKSLIIRGKTAFPAIKKR
ncbi:MAG: hypothetical protein FJ117_15275 [Deltaproteobacteria bacterium]|nr:hypothetical protein [Deltaproteobacteria bacterium]